MKTAKIFCLLLALCLCAALFAACAKTGPAGTPSASDPSASSDTTADASPQQTVDPSDIYAPENRVPAAFAGTYISGSCSIEAVAVSETEMRFTVRWNASETEARVWEMSGTFSSDRLSVAFDDCAYKDVTYGADGSVASETVRYQNGTGSIQFYDFMSLCWTDDQDHAASGMTFARTAE